MQAAKPIPAIIQQAIKQMQPMHPILLQVIRQIQAMQRPIVQAMPQQVIKLAQITQRQTIKPI